MDNPQGKSMSETDTLVHFVTFYHDFLEED